MVLLLSHEYLSHEYYCAFGQPFLPKISPSYDVQHNGILPNERFLNCYKVLIGHADNSLCWENLEKPVSYISDLLEKQHFRTRLGNN